MNKPKKNLLPLSKAVLWIFLSVCLIAGTSFVGIVLYKFIREKKQMDPANTIVAVVQTCSDMEGLKTAYLVELLGLSVDRPANLYAFNANEARDKLLKTPVLKDAKLRKILPGTIHVEYKKRIPIAYYGDYTNTAIDREGVIFPFKPFYTPKRLPEIITGHDLLTDEGTPLWGQKVKNRWVTLSFDILKLSTQFCDDKSQLKRIDVSRAFADNAGSREIVIMVDERFVKMKEGESVVCVYPRVLRFSTCNYRQQLSNYLSLRTHLREMEKGDDFTASRQEGKMTFYAPLTVIDMRMGDLAFYYKDKSR